MLTKRQFALAVGSSEKWVDNARRILQLPSTRDEAHAKLLAAVREIAQPFGMRLECAAELARQALALEPALGPTALRAHPNGTARLVFDVRRFQSRFSIALAVALLDRPRRAGRPAPRFPRGARTRPAILTGAAERGVNVPLIRSLAFATPAQRFASLGNGACTVLRDLAQARIPFVLAGEAAELARGAPRPHARLELCYAMRRSTPRRLTTLLGAWEAHLRGVSDEYPGALDEHSVEESPVLPLDTRLGGVVLRRSSGPEFAKLVQFSDRLDLGTVHALVPRLPALIAASSATGRAAPATAIPELEAAAVVLNRIN